MRLTTASRFRFHGWAPGMRHLAACLMALAWILPNDVLQAQEDLALQLRANLARFDALCRDTRPAPPIRVLIYGQSITARPWTTAAFQPLQDRFPDRSWIIENRCIGGLTAPYLLRTAEADLFPFHPDLVVFHAFGDTNAYASLILEIRRRTTADILLINDPYALWDAPVFPQLGEWSSCILPGLALANGACMADVRTPWRDLLVRSNLPIQALLSDHVHPNADGEALLQDVLERTLTTELTEPLPDPANNDRVTTLHLPLSAEDSGTWTVPFTGNRVVALAGPGIASVRINDRAPRDTPEARVHGRAGPWPGSWRPFLLRIRHAAPLLDETWTLHVEAVDGPRSVRFSVTGSTTGHDGTGSSDKPFRSDSGRVLIDPRDWYWEGMVQPVATSQAFAWATVAMATDPVILPETAPERWINLVSGLEPGRHQLTLRQRPGAPSIRTLRIHAPPEPRAAVVEAQVTNGAVTGLRILDPGYRYVTWPAVTLPRAAGSHAMALAMASHGVLASIDIQQGGSGYPVDVRPVVDPPERPPRAATAGVTMRGGGVHAVWVIDGGHGYLDPPRVRLVGGDGVGAEAVATLRQGAVDAILVTMPGTGYSRPPVVRVDPPGPGPSLRIEPLDGAVRLRLANQGSWRIEASRDLTTWTEVGVVTNAARPFLELLDAAPAEAAFFRLAPH